MNDYELVNYQTENNNEIVMIVMFEHEMFTDYKILINFNFDIPFRKI